MSTPINMNTASFEELKKINGVGDKRAQMILAKRREKDGQLTLEDLKLMSEIPNTLWDPLIETGIITLEPPEISPEQSQIQKMTILMENLQQDFTSLKKERDSMKIQFEQRMKEMEVDLKVKMKNQEHHYEKQLEAHAKQHREEIDKILRESEAREGQLKLQIAERDSKLRQEEETVTSPLEDKSLLEKLIGNVSSTSKEKTREITTQGRQNGPLPPKLSTYDGSRDWRPYFVQFDRIANRYQWSEGDRLEKFVECLRDKALKFFATKPEEIQNNYRATCKKFEERFGRKDLPNVIRRQLQELRQFPEESLDDYAERAQDLATDGFPGTPDSFIQIVATDAFLKGCLDKKAALTAIDKDPENLDKALQYVKSAVTNQRVILGLKKQEVKRVTFLDSNTDNNESEEENPVPSSVRAVYKTGELDLARFDARLKKTEGDLKETKDSLKKILELLKESNGQRSRSPQRSTSPRQSPVRRGVCYACGEEGHFAADCKNPRERSPSRMSARARSPSPTNRGSLNFRGLKA